MTTMIARIDPLYEMDEAISCEQLVTDDNAIAVAPIRLKTINRSTLQVANHPHEVSIESDEVDESVLLSKRIDKSREPRIRPSPSQREIARVCSLPTAESPIGEVASFELKRSGYPLLNVRCQCVDQRLVLTGFVSRFYYVQMAIEAARAIAKGRRIEVQIVVQNSKTSILRTDE